METLPIELIHVISGVESTNHGPYRVLITILRSLNKHHNEIIKAPTLPRPRLTEYFIRCNNLAGMGWYLSRQQPIQRYIKFVAKAIREHCDLRLIICICDHIRNNFPFYDITENGKFVKLIIRYNRNDVLKHLWKHDSLIPSRRYLGYCLEHLNIAAAGIILLGRHVPNYYIHDGIIYDKIWQYGWVRSQRQTTIDIIALLASRGCLHHRQIGRLCKYVYLTDRNIDLLKALFTNYSGPRIRISYDYEKSDLNKYLRDCQHVDLI